MFGLHACMRASGSSAGPDHQPSSGLATTVQLQFENKALAITRGLRDEESGPTYGSPQI